MKDRWLHVRCDEELHGRLAELAPRRGAYAGVSGLVRGYLEACAGCAPAEVEEAVELARYHYGKGQALWEGLGEIDRRHLLLALRSRRWSIGNLAHLPRVCDDEKWMSPLLHDALWNAPVGSLWGLWAYLRELGLLELDPTPYGADFSGNGTSAGSKEDGHEDEREDEPGDGTEAPPGGA